MDRPASFLTMTPFGMHPLNPLALYVLQSYACKEPPVKLMSLYLIVCSVPHDEPSPSSIFSSPSPSPSPSSLPLQSTMHVYLTEFSPRSTTRFHWRVPRTLFKSLRAELLSCGRPTYLLPQLCDILPVSTVLLWPLLQRPMATVWWPTSNPKLNL